ncbi:MAG: hypothetical protein JSU61_08915 [Fidelibacterota bacterium]|nr:MAG: hypothetical protein JSU61_08915 [Candidatus Neomarinimicrobiota bacterium]
MEVTKNVILDLLPLYSADEVSADTRVLVEEYLAAHPEFAAAVRESGARGLSGDIPVPLTRDDQMKAYVKAKRRMLIYTVLLAGLMAITVLAVLMFFFIPAS